MIDLPEKQHQVSAVNWQSRGDFALCVYSPFRPLFWVKQVKGLNGNGEVVLPREGTVFQMVI